MLRTALLLFTRRQSAGARGGGGGGFVPEENNFLLVFRIKDAQTDDWHQGHGSAGCRTSADGEHGAEATSRFSTGPSHLEPRDFPECLLYL